MSARHPLPARPPVVDMAQLATPPRLQAHQAPAFSPSASSQGIPHSNPPHSPLSAPSNDGPLLDPPFVLSSETQRLATTFSLPPNPVIFWKSYSAAVPSPLSTSTMTNSSTGLTGAVPDTASLALQTGLDSLEALRRSIASSWSAPDNFATSSSASTSPIFSKLLCTVVPPLSSQNGSLRSTGKDREHPSPASLPDDNAPGVSSSVGEIWVFEVISEEEMKREAAGVTSGRVRLSSLSPSGLHELSSGSFTPQSLYPCISAATTLAQTTCSSNGHDCCAVHSHPLLPVFSNPNSFPSTLTSPILLQPKKQFQSAYQMFLKAFRERVLDVMASKAYTGGATSSALSGQENFVRCDDGLFIVDKDRASYGGVESEWSQSWFKATQTSLRFDFNLTLLPHLMLLDPILTRPHVLPLDEYSALKSHSSIILLPLGTQATFVRHWLGSLPNLEQFKASLIGRGVALENVGRGGWAVCRMPLSKDDSSRAAQGGSHGAGDPSGGLKNLKGKEEHLKEKSLYFLWPCDLILHDTKAAPQPPNDSKIHSRTTASQSVSSTPRLPSFASSTYWTSLISQQSQPSSSASRSATSLGDLGDRLAGIATTFVEDVIKEREREKEKLEELKRNNPYSSPALGEGSPADLFHNGSLGFSGLTPNAASNAVSVDVDGNKSNDDDDLFGSPSPPPTNAAHSFADQPPVPARRNTLFDNMDWTNYESPSASADPKPGPQEEAYMVDLVTDDDFDFFNSTPAGGPSNHEVANVSQLDNFGLSLSPLPVNFANNGLSFDMEADMATPATTGLTPLPNHMFALSPAGAHVSSPSYFNHKTPKTPFSPQIDIEMMDHDAPSTVGHGLFSIATATLDKSDGVAMSFQPFTFGAKDDAMDSRYTQGKFALPSPVSMHSDDEEPEKVKWVIGIDNKSKRLKIQPKEPLKSLRPAGPRVNFNRFSRDLTKVTAPTSNHSTPSTSSSNTNPKSTLRIGLFRSETLLSRDFDKRLKITPSKFENASSERTDTPLPMSDNGDTVEAMSESGQSEKDGLEDSDEGDEDQILGLLDETSVLSSEIFLIPMDPLTHMPFSNVLVACVAKVDISEHPHIESAALTKVLTPAPTTAPTPTSPPSVVSKKEPTLMEIERTGNWLARELIENAPLRKHVRKSADLLVSGEERNLFPADVELAQTLLVSCTFDANSSPSCPLSVYSSLACGFFNSVATPKRRGSVSAKKRRNSNEEQQLIVSLKSPFVTTGRDGALMRISHVALRFWQKLDLAPAGGRKSVRAFLLYQTEGSASESHMESWLKNISSTYEALGYGDHKYGCSIAPRGLLGMDGQNTIPGILEKLAVSLMEDRNRYPIVLYFVAPFGVKFSHVYLFEVSHQVSLTMAKLRKFSEATFLLFQPVSSRCVGDGTDAVQLNTFDRIALSVYDRITYKISRIAPRPLFPDDTTTAAMQFPAFRLARDSSLKMGFTPSWPPLARDLVDSIITIHMAYGFSPDLGSAAAFIIDERGEAFEHRSWKIPSVKLDGGQTIFDLAVSNFWMVLQTFVKKTNSRHRICICKWGLMTTAEISAWDTILKKQATMAPGNPCQVVVSCAAHSTPLLLNQPLSHSHQNIGESFIPSSQTFMDSSVSTLAIFPSYRIPFSAPQYTSLDPPSSNEPPISFNPPTTLLPLSTFQLLRAPTDATLLTPVSPRAVTSLNVHSLLLAFPPKTVPVWETFQQDLAQNFHALTILGRERWDFNDGDPLPAHLAGVREMVDFSMHFKSGKMMI